MKLQGHHVTSVFICGWVRGWVCIERGVCLPLLSFLCVLHDRGPPPQNRACIPLPHGVGLMRFSLLPNHLLLDTEAWKNHVPLQRNGLSLGSPALGHLGREGWGQRSHCNSWVTKPLCHRRAELSSKCPCLILDGSTVMAGTFSWLICSLVPITQPWQPHRNR